ncbi:30S ribosomal protein S15 [Candidatus Cytomitobacter indipagum]|uniref:Small ribosomal subunit protein uS15 n=1 Tax=Candidatus Cytomitobacter indipagum TaxID=2601575 RepID=A0A5C0UDZ9_9PROT|nr:30S ribosomal protein S15 [Candidatus Cytomitobacter indipagum]
MVNIDKQEIINQFREHDTDTGSSQLQIALLTKRIQEMSEHLKTHKKDFPVQRRLKQLASYRKKLGLHVRKQGENKLLELNKRLGLRN